MYPVLVVSKGRPESKTAALLEESGIPFRIIVEPQDREKYRERWGEERTVEISKNDQGLAFARNFALRLAYNESFGWFWMLDDDISAFHVVRDRKAIPRPAKEVLSGAEQLFSSDPKIAQAALEYRQYAWSASRDQVFNSYCDVAVAIHAARASMFAFRPNTGVKADRDFTLQLLAARFKTIRTCKFSFSSPENGSNKGGLREEYANPENEAKSVQEMARIWGRHICEPVRKKTGRIDCKVNWSYFKPEDPGDKKITS